MPFLSRHAKTIEALAACITPLVAVAALIGVKVQLDAADRQHRAQDARETYRAHLALAATQPQFAAPSDGCTLIASDQGGAYVAFVDHLLYSAEQMLEVADGWETSFLAQLDAHEDYLCAPFAPEGDTVETEALLTQYKQSCPATPTCAALN